MKKLLGVGLSILLVLMLSGSAVLAGSEVFTGFVPKDARETLYEIPEGVVDLQISLEATRDVDIELYSGETFVLGWKALIDSSGATTGIFEGDSFVYSGWRGSVESVSIEGLSANGYTLKVFGYRAGDYEVIVDFTVPGEVSPPQITIEVADTPLGSSTLLAVSVVDPSGVEQVSFSISPEEEMPIIEAEVEATGASSVSFWTTFELVHSDNYTVEVWAVDALGNETLEDEPETATFEVYDSGVE